MREILFRGKIIELCENQGQWLEGFYAVENGKPFIAIPKENGLNGFYCDPETVGQYTGLTDKNGMRIFVGDIVRTKKYGRIIELKDHTYTNVSDYDTFVVCYSPCMFRLLREKPDRGFNLVNDGYAQLEVIGNIHDNPELLEGKNETWY